MVHYCVTKNGHHGYNGNPLGTTLLLQVPRTPTSGTEGEKMVEKVNSPVDSPTDS